MARRVSILDAPENYVKVLTAELVPRPRASWIAGLEGC